MKRGILVGLIIAALVLVAGFAVPLLAQGPADGDPITTDQDTWETMHEACEAGDWEAMAEAAEQVHEDLGGAPCHESEYPASEDGTASSQGGVMGGHMGGSGGMMSW